MILIYVSFSFCDGMSAFIKGKIHFHYLLCCLIQITGTWVVYKVKLSQSIWFSYPLCLQVIHLRFGHRDQPASLWRNNEQGGLREGANKLKNDGDFFRDLQDCSAFAGCDPNDATKVAVCTTAGPSPTPAPTGGGACFLRGKPRIPVLARCVIRSWFPPVSRTPSRGGGIAAQCVGIRIA